MKNIIKITAFAFAVTFLSAMVLSAQDHGDMKKSDKKTESKTQNHKMMDAKMMDKNNDGKVFQCEMHPDQISDKADNCSKCDSKLSEVSVADANSNMMKKGMMMDHSKIMDHDKMKMKKDHSMKESHVVHKGVIDVDKIDVNKDGKVYQDTMDWNVISDKPGECPLCGMNLKEVT
ncbi:Probable Co/Zn/Cd efflux system membrane fusion protein, partial [hydrothermal vent metagenome]